MNVRDALDRVDLAELLTELSGPPVGSGRSQRWHCCHRDHPDEHPSVTVSTDRGGVQRWRCWSGGHGGTAVDALIAAHGVDVREAMAILERRVGLVSAPMSRPITGRSREPVGQPLSAEACSFVDECAARLWSPAGEPARDWLHRRGLSDQVLVVNRVGFDPGAEVLDRAVGLPRVRGVTYPSFDAAGQLVYVQSRALDAGASSKYVNPTRVHGRAPMVSFPLVDRPLDGPLVVTEGVPDGLIAVTAGFRSASVLSAAVVSRTIADAIVERADGEEVVVAFDNDQAGRTGEQLLVSHLRGRVPLRIMRLPDGCDLTDAYTGGRSRRDAAGVRAVGSPMLSR